jgi:hypothetical protein
MRCYEIRRRAERQAGEIRRQEEKNKGGDPTPSPSGRKGPPTNAKRREELGITRKQDETWQTLAAVPKEQFEAAFASRLPSGDKMGLPGTSAGECYEG